MKSKKMPYDFKNGFYIKQRNSSQTIFVKGCENKKNGTICLTWFDKKIKRDRSLRLTRTNRYDYDHPKINDCYSLKQLKDIISDGTYEIIPESRVGKKLASELKTQTNNRIMSSYPKKKRIKPLNVKSLLHGNNFTLNNFTISTDFGELLGLGT